MTCGRVTPLSSQITVERCFEARRGGNGRGLGLNSLFLRYGRDAERQADVGAVQLMRRAGYDPNGLSSFMRTLKGGGGFFSDHPSPANRIERIQQEIALTGGTNRAARRGTR